MPSLHKRPFVEALNELRAEIALETTDSPEQSPETDETILRESLRFRRDHAGTLVENYPVPQRFSEE